MLNTRIMLDFKNKISDFRVLISYLFRCSIFYFLTLIFTIQFLFQLPAQTLPNIKAIGTSSSQTTTSTSLSSSSTSLRGNGMMFTENKGQLLDMNQQIRPDILFAGDAGGMDVFLRTTGISYVMSNIAEVTNKVDDQLEELGVAGILKKVPKSEIEKNLLSKQPFKVNRIDMDFVNCRSVNEYDVQTFDKVDGYSNYYYSHCPDGITHVNSYNKVTVKNIYNGIDVKYYGGKQNDLKYDIIVNPAADPSQIKLQYIGAKLIELRNGKLKIETSDGMLGEYMPKVYQNINGQIVDVKAEYELEMKCENLDNRNDNRKNKSYISQLSSQIYEITFKLGTYNFEFPLVIDPWVSYYGGSQPDRGCSVATDNLGNVVFTGQTQSINFPVTAGVMQTVFNGNIDAFVVKMNVNGGRVWATYYGGTDREYGWGIATDAGGNIIVSGETWSSNLPIASAHQGVYGTATDAFLLKLNSLGVMQWATYYGGTGYDSGIDVTTDGSNIYLYGSTLSTTSISTTGIFQTTIGGGGDCFVVKFLSTGVRSWGTYIGGGGAESAGGITCDALGNVLVSGTTNSTNFPVGFSGTNVVYKNSLTGTFDDVFVFKLNPLCVRLWATYFGGPGSDYGISIAVDSLNNVIVAGSTDSNTGIAYNGTTQLIFGGAVDNYIAKFSSTGTGLWGTYVGGNMSESFGAVATDANNNIYILAEWEDNTPGNYIASTCAYQPNPGGGPGRISEDQFIAKYTPSGIQTCLTYLGGPDEDDIEPHGGGGITINGNNLYITAGAGENFPVTTGAYQTNYAGPFPSSQGGDAYIAQLCINICEAKTLDPEFSVSKICPNSPVVFSPGLNNTCDTSNYKFLWTFTGGSPASSTLPKPTITFSTPGFYTGKLVVTTPCQKDSVTNTIVVNPCSIDATVDGATICPGTCTNLSVTGLTGTSPYTYSWSTGAKSNTINVCPTTTTTYTVMVTDANGLTFAAVPVVVVRSSIITMTGSGNIFNCSVGGGYIDVLVANPSGLGTITYTWNSGEINPNIYPKVAGNYIITITDGFGCTKTNAFDIIDTRPPADPSFTVSATCVNQPVYFTHTGTTGAGVTYTWTIGAPINVSGTTTNFSYTFLTPGNYTVTHTVKNTCTNSLTYTITVVDCGNTPTVTTTGSSVCSGSCATVTASGVGGSPPYTYSWSNGSATQSITPCPTNTTTYTVTIKDTGGSTSTSTAVVTVYPVVTVTTNPTNITCSGSSTGSITATGSGGTLGYTYNWSNGGTTSQISNLTSQIYTVTITDGKGCTATTSTLLVSPTPLSGQFSKGTATCSNCGCKEWLLVNATGGTPPYTYLWPDFGGYDSRYKNKLCPGNYSVKVTDKNGCSVDVSVSTP